MQRKSQGQKLCFLTQSVQLTLSSVQLTLLECVMWSSKMQWRFLTLSLSWNLGKNEQICTVKFQNFLGAMPPDPHTEQGLRRPSPNPTPSALRRFAPPCLARGLRLLHLPSLCAVDILRYFRPWKVVLYTVVLEKNTTHIILAKTGSYSPPQKRLQYIMDANK